VDHLASKTDLQSFIIWMRSKGFTPGGCNVRIHAVNSFLSWVYEQGITPEHMKLKLLRAERKAIATLNDAEIRRLVTFRPKTYTDRRAWTITVLLLDTGLRIKEILTLERKNVDLDNLILKVLGKGSKERLVPISVEGRKHLWRWTTIKRGRESRWCFSALTGTRLQQRNTYRDIQMVCRRAGIVTKVHPHAFRHCFAVTYIRRGGDIYRLSRLLGHASISTTQIYLRSMGIEHLREAHDSFSPLTAA
jgi:integrase/recombinase XerD